MLVSGNNLGRVLGFFLLDVFWCRRWRRRCGVARERLQP
jgi:hypothetical protein